MVYVPPSAGALMLSTSAVMVALGAASPGSLYLSPAQLLSTAEQTIINEYTNIFFIIL